MARLIRPTPEQQAIVDAVAGGGSIKIKACAGAVKASTLRLVANRLVHQRGIYLAFNREIAEHALRGYLEYVLINIADHKVNHIDELLPWNVPDRFHGNALRRHPPPDLWAVLRKRPVTLRRAVTISTCCPLT